MQTSQTIPTLSKPENHERWRKLEQAKRRLIYDLLRLGLPVDPSRLRFVFKEDRRTNPDVGDDHVSIGHANGVITINAAEADEVYREQMRQQMNEPYRTLLGHFRHESGHYYFNVVIGDELRDEARSLFGDESLAMTTRCKAITKTAQSPDGRSISSPAMRARIRRRTGPNAGHITCIFAPCWKSADTTGLRTDTDVQNWPTEFIDLVIAINEILRSLGLPGCLSFRHNVGDCREDRIRAPERFRRFSGRRGEPSAAS